MKCKQCKCEAEATTECHWPGQTTQQCDEHTKAIVRMGVFMGFHVTTTPIPDSAATTGKETT